MEGFREGSVPPRKKNEHFMKMIPFLYLRHQGNRLDDGGSTDL
jgi:hypothetical protein